MNRFLVQKYIDGEVFGVLMSENELISYINMSDVYDEEYRIYDISNFGSVQEVFYKGWQPGCLIEVVDAAGEVILRGYGEDH